MAFNGFENARPATTDDGRYQVSARNIRPRDLVATGWGTLNVQLREVTQVYSWQHNGYTNAEITFTNGEKLTLWADTFLSRYIRL